MRDRAFLNYHFGKLGKEGWKALAEPDPKELPDPHVRAARGAFLADYGLPEHQQSRVTRRAAVDFLRALKARRVPGWVLNLAPYEDIKTLGGEK